MGAPTQCDCLVVGGGVIGLSIAEQLSLAGQQTHVVDFKPVAHIASWAAAGILPPPAQRALHDPMEQLRELSHRGLRAWCDRLTNESGVDVEFRACGGIYIARSAGEGAALSAALDQWNNDGVRVEKWSVDDVRRAEPSIGSLPSGTQVFFVPDECQVRPTRILTALNRVLQRRGVVVETTSEAVEWINSDALQMAVNKRTIQANCICLAAGPWTEQLLRPLDIRLPLEPRRGQMVLWDHQSPFLQRIVNEGPRYLVRRCDGHLLAGSTVEDAGYSAETTDAAIAELRGFAETILPQLKNRPPKATWAALRAMPADGRPYMGRVPGHERVTVATGHFRSGIHLAAASAELMRQLILEQPLSLDLEAFRLNR